MKGEAEKLPFFFYFLLFSCAKKVRQKGRFEPFQRRLLRTAYSIRCALLL